MTTPQPIIRFQNVTKQYPIEREHRLKRAIFNPFRRVDNRTFTALHNLKIEIYPHEVVGLVGPNGSGKTTILRLIAGIVYPTSGIITVSGKVAPLIELGAGFHHDFSGRENVYMNGVVLGMSISEINEKFRTIVDFAGPAVTEFIDMPLKKYSLGMKARLAFSVAVHTSPEILLVDESLSVGDQEFKEKCKRKIADLIRQGTTIVMTTHNMSYIESFCTRVITLEKGRIT
jgi:ABC-type polysaccharide/polyol phosphate transport system ATPase subunit